MPEIKRLLALMGGVFPPGTPISTFAFLTELIKFLQADQAALLLVRLDHRHQTLKSIDRIHHNGRAIVETADDAEVEDSRVWSKDPVVQRLSRRVKRRPRAHFCYNTRRWTRRLKDEPSLIEQFLNDLGARHEITSLISLDGTLFCLLSLYRTRPDAQAFTHFQRKILALLHRALGERIIELRARSLRKSMPIILRETFTLLLSGYGEKEIAKRIHRSPNTIHDHVKRIYQHFHVTSRGQLMARFVCVEKLKNFEL